jgi:hypothetical protein
MYSAFSAIGKNLILLGVLVLSAINFFYGWFNWKDLLAIQSLAGLAFIFLSCYEFLNAQYKASLPVQRYAYFTNSYVMLKVFKICLYISFAAMLYLSGTRVKYIYPICVIIAVTEGLVMFLKYRRGICFVSIYANYLLFSQDKLSKLFASEIEIVEFRHDIFYFIKKNKKAHQVKLEHIEQREQFLLAMYDWLKRNRINVGNESEVKLNSVKAGL